ncbi:MAG: hypothetical protein ACC645_08995 [Pirellulales bacterium]
MMTHRQALTTRRLLTRSTSRVAWTRLAFFGVILGGSVTAVAQPGPIHYFHSAHLPPGTVGQGQQVRNAWLRGYFQPVEIQVPDGARVSVKVDGKFSTPREKSVLAGMQIGLVYRFKVTEIPFAEGSEVFPTIELVNRLYPPPGLKQRFPVPVQLTKEELELALGGRYVTRIIYLEDPSTALPLREEPGFQRYFEAPAGQDPLLVADQLGRPMAILRMGSRVPENDDDAAYGSPPLIVYPDQPATAAENPSLKNDSPAIERRGHHVPRLPLEPPTTRGFSPVGFQTRP